MSGQGGANTAAHPDQLLKMGVTTVYSSLRFDLDENGFTRHSCRNRARRFIRVATGPDAASR